VIFRSACGVVQDDLMLGAEAHSEPHHTFVPDHHILVS
jgi:hypothetical protein